MAEVLEAEDVAEDLDRYTEAMDDMGHVEENPVGAAGSFEATAGAENARYGLEDVLRELRAAAEPGWIRGTRTGRINAGRLASPIVDPSRLFDRYRAGARDAVSTEAVVLLDGSGSMDTAMAELSEAVWVLRHAASAAGVSVSVYIFDESHALVFGPETEPTETVESIANLGGGTIPNNALRAAWSRLAGSRAANRILLILTDGEWTRNVAEAEDLIQTIKAEDVITALVHYGDDSPNPHGVDHYVSARDLDALPILFAAIVEEAMAKALHR